MLIDNISDMDNYKVETVTKSQMIQKTLSDNNVLKDDTNLLNKGVDFSVNKDSTKEYFETKIDSSLFGFNKETQDFFLRIDKNNIIYQFPSESILKMKEFMQNSSSDLKNELPDKSFN